MRPSVIATDQAYSIQDEGRKVVAVTGTAVQITTTENASVMTIQALPTNGALVAVGKSTAAVTAGSERGWQLEPGQILELKTMKANVWYLNGTANDGVIFEILG